MGDPQTIPGVQLPRQLLDQRGLALDLRTCTSKSGLTVDATLVFHDHGFAEHIELVFGARELAVGHRRTSATSRIFQLQDAPSARLKLSFSARAVESEGIELGAEVCDRVFVRFVRSTFCLRLADDGPSRDRFFFAGVCQRGDEIVHQAFAASQLALELLNGLRALTKEPFDSSELRAMRFGNFGELNGERSCAHFETLEIAWLFGAKEGLVPCEGEPLFERRDGGSRNDQGPFERLDLLARNSNFLGETLHASALFHELFL